MSELTQYKFEPQLTVHEGETLIINKENTEYKIVNEEGIIVDRGMVIQEIPAFPKFTPGMN